MQKPDINTVKNVVPMIYAYTTPEIARHNGWTKIGYTEQKVEDRIKQQTHTADVQWNLEWSGNAIFDDGSGKLFTDKDFHSYLRKNGVEQEKGKNNEWFKITGQESKIQFFDFRSNREIEQNNSDIIPYKLRKEQNDAVEKTIAYRENHKNGEFLWNAKPRFGKTLSVYDFCKRIQAKKVLIVTNRPAIANSWYEDYIKFVGRESGYFFVSDVDGVRKKPFVISYQEYRDDRQKRQKYKATDDMVDMGIIYFVSLQNLKGSIYFGGAKEKLKEISTTNWDVLVIDEAHEGVDTYKTDVAFERIERKFTLHLSGTPFKALANNKFESNAIYNWTYVDEQKAKRDWDISSEEENPYETLPKLNLFTYQMSEIIKEELQQGVEINGETEEYAFDLNDFFSTDNNGKFVYNTSVDNFLDALTLQEKFPFSTQELRDKLKHTFWFLNRVESARALEKKLRNHPVFKDYKVILAVGNGGSDEDEETKKSYDKVVTAIKGNDKTITLSVGQLTTGVTIPEWTAVLMLCNLKSPALYMQAAFRAQNPCLFKNGLSYERKQNAYVFDFDPARTLNIFEDFANDLSVNTSAGRGNLETRKENIRELLNFFPVIGEDEKGELIELDAEKVMTIPKKIRSVEVVRRGFMSNFLFQNISQIFNGPKDLTDIISKFEPVDKSKMNFSENTKEELSLNDDGEVDVSDEMVVGVSNGIFGDKIFAPTETIDLSLSKITDKPENAANEFDKLKSAVKTMTENIVAEAKTVYGSEMKPTDRQKLQSEITGKVDKIINKSIENYKIDNNVIEQERAEALQARHKTGLTSEEINKQFDKKAEEVKERFKKTIMANIDEIEESSKKDTVKIVETNKREREKMQIEGSIRDRLRGFSRTVPSFLMAYGNKDVTLENFDKIIPDNVFQEVTGVTLKDFRLLRDGGSYVDSETGEEKIIEGNLFDSDVFNDSVKEFLALKKKLANYFDENSVQDIFDYIPPQKTNQIFTPKKIVKKMVDMLEEENPACFASPNKTFVDLYMKSGQYIAEIVKRLYQNDEMKKLYPDKYDRLRHIFEKQVYGLAPTEIIYKIATNYILGFDEDLNIKKHNFKQLDALPYAKEGTLKNKIDEIYK